VWLFLFLLLIPTQLGKHFWPDWSYVLGIRIDYLSPTLYLLDIIWILLIIFNFKFFKFDKNKIFNFKNLIVVGFVAVNVLVSVSPWVAIYKWLRIIQILITFIYIRNNKELVWKNLKKIIPIWIIFESLLAIAQMSKDGSLNGIFYWFGERNFSFNTIGIAQMSVMGNGLIRAYGTFSHPNSLAGFLLVSLLLWFWLKEKINKVWWWMVLWFGLVGILVSGSRTIWVLTLGIILGLIFGKIKNKTNAIGLILVFLGVIVFVLRLINSEYPLSNFLGGWDANGIAKRWQLNVAGLRMIKESPWFGVGLGNFLVKLPEFQKNSGIYWLQPAHNILILALSQIGILGLSVGFIFFNYFFSKVKIDFIFKIILGVVVVSGMVDHYWLTLPQNVWLLTIVLGLI
jgi:O-antigen ligase